MAATETATVQGGMQGVAAGAPMGAPGMIIGGGIGAILGYMGASDQARKAKAAHRKQEEFRKHQNKYSSFFGKQPTMERAHLEKSVIPGTVSSATQFAKMGGAIANMYRDKPKYNTQTGESLNPPDLYDAQTGEPIEQTVGLSPVGQNYYA